jgi:hypothetical protein
MIPSDDWVFVVAAAHAAGKDDHSENGVTVRRIRGGANNALYRVDVEGQSFACKLCVDDERRRAARDALRVARSNCFTAPGWTLRHSPFGLTSPVASSPIRRWLTSGYVASRSTRRRPQGSSRPCSPRFSPHILSGRASFPVTAFGRHGFIGSISEPISPR